MKGIEIPFGAKDSELCGWEYTIPEGMEAVVEDGKVIVRRTESEDERIRMALIKLMTVAGENYVMSATGFEKEQLIAYLERQKEQKTTEWSEEERMRKAALEGIEYLERELGWDAIGDTDILDIKEYLEREPAEWSEEDGNKLHQVMEVLSADKTIALRENPHCKALHRAYDELLDWLKSLRPQPHWKPSEEQMRFLLRVESELRVNGHPIAASNLAKLYEDLKKL